MIRSALNVGFPLQKHKPHFNSHSVQWFSSIYVRLPRVLPYPCVLTFFNSDRIHLFHFFFLSIIPTPTHLHFYPFSRAWLQTPGNASSRIFYWISSSDTCPLSSCRPSIHLRRYFYQMARLFKANLDSLSRTLISTFLSSLIFFHHQPFD